MTRFRRSLHWLRAAAFSASGATWYAKRRLRETRAVVVLAFHRVLDTDDQKRTNSLPGMVLGAQTFEDLCDCVARRYHAVPLDTTREWGAGNHLSFTFDDAWADTYAVAHRIASRHGIPIAVFACSAFIGRRAPYWPENVAAAIRMLVPAAGNEEIETSVERLKHTSQLKLERLRAVCEQMAKPDAETHDVDRTMSWTELSELSRAGVVVGSHTATHQILTAATKESADAEIRASKEMIEGHLQRPCTLFSFPNGNNSKRLRDMVGCAGYRAAFTMTSGAWMPGRDDYAIPRINVCEDSVVGPRGRFSRLRFDYTVFWRAWRAWRAGQARG